MIGKSIGAAARFGRCSMAFNELVTAMSPPVARKNQSCATPALMFSFDPQSALEAVNLAFARFVHEPFEGLTQVLPKRASRKSFALAVSRRKSSINE